MEIHLYDGAEANTTSTTATKSSENVTSCFCHYFSIIRSHYACKMCSNYPRIKLEPAKLEIRRPHWTFVIICSGRPHNCKTGHFALWKERERPRNVQNWKMYARSVQLYCFLSSNMKIRDVLANVVVLLFEASYVLCLTELTLSTSHLEVSLLIDSYWEDQTTLTSHKRHLSASEYKSINSSSYS